MYLEETAGHGDGDQRSVGWTVGGCVEDGHSICQKITQSEEACAGKSLCVLTTAGVWWCLLAAVSTQ